MRPMSLHGKGREMVDFESARIYSIDRNKQGLNIKKLRQEVIL
jgi:hypothetical protein